MNRFREYDLVFAGYATRFPKLTMERDNGVLVLRLPRRTAGRSSGASRFTVSCRWLPSDR